MLAVTRLLQDDPGDDIADLRLGSDLAIVPSFDEAGRQQEPQERFNPNYADYLPAQLDGTTGLAVIGDINGSLDRAVALWMPSDNTLVPVAGFDLMDIRGKVESVTVTPR